MLNRIFIMGRLTRDPEMRRTNSGNLTASFTVAVDRDYAPQGQQKQTDFIDCVAWNKTAEFIEKYFRKGSMVVVCGRLELRDWTDSKGNKRRSAEINVEAVYFGESKSTSPAAQNRTQSGYNRSNSYNAPSAPQEGFAELDDDDGELPF